MLRWGGESWNSWKQTFARTPTHTFPQERELATIKKKEIKTQQSQRTPGKLQKKLMPGDGKCWIIASWKETKWTTAKLLFWDDDCSLFFRLVGNGLTLLLSAFRRLPADFLFTPRCNGPPHMPYSHRRRCRHTRPNYVVLFSSLWPVSRLPRSFQSVGPRKMEMPVMNDCWCHIKDRLMLFAECQNSHPATRQPVTSLAVTTGKFISMNSWE